MKNKKEIVIIFESILKKKNGKKERKNKGINRELGMTNWHWSNIIIIIIIVVRFRRISGFYRLLFKRFYHFFDVITGGGGEDIRFLFNISGNLFFYNGTLDP